MSVQNSCFFPGNNIQQDLIIDEFPNATMSKNNDTFKYIHGKFIPNFEKTEESNLHFKLEETSEKLDVFMEIEKDKKGYLAYSDTYYNIFGSGKTKEDAYKWFIKAFNHVHVTDENINRYEFHSPIGKI